MRNAATVSAHLFDGSTLGMRYNIQGRYGKSYIFKSYINRKKLFQKKTIKSRFGPISHTSKGRLERLRFWARGRGPLSEEERQKRDGKNVMVAVV